MKSAMSAWTQNKFPTLRTAGVRPPEDLTMTICMSYIEPVRLDDLRTSNSCDGDSRPTVRRLIALIRMLVRVRGMMACPKQDLFWRGVTTTETKHIFHGVTAASTASIINHRSTIYSCNTLPSTCLSRLILTFIYAGVTANSLLKTFPGSYLAFNSFNLS